MTDSQRNLRLAAAFEEVGCDIALRAGVASAGSVFAISPAWRTLTSKGAGSTPPALSQPTPAGGSHHAIGFTPYSAMSSP
jgi:hypothetical protein